MMIEKKEHDCFSFDISSFRVVSSDRKLKSFTRLKLYIAQFTSSEI